MVKMPRSVTLFLNSCDAKYNVSNDRCIGWRLPGEEGVLLIMKTRYILVMLIIIALLAPAGAFSDISEKFEKHREKIETYRQNVYAAIAEHWTIPESYETEKKNLSAAVKVFVNERGKIVSYRWSKKSGDNIFDEACIRTIEEAEKLPHPPAEMALSVLREGLVVKFSTSDSVSTGVKSFLCPAMKDKINSEGYKSVGSYKDELYVFEVSSILRKKYHFSQFDQNRIYNRALGLAKIESVVGLDVDGDGVIQKVEIVCPSRVSYFDDLVSKSFKKIRELPKPPSHLLAKDGRLKLLVPCRLYKNAY